MAKKSSKKQDNSILLIGAIIVAFFVFSGGNIGSQAVSGFTDVQRSITVGGNKIVSGTPKVYSGSALTVTLDIFTSNGVRAITIHDEAPFNIIGSPLGNNIYETALVDQIQVQDDVKSYQIVPQAGIHNFNGIYAVNGGSDQAISGLQSIEVVSCSPTAETCNNIDEDCDYQIDEDLSQSCYTGPANTEGVGICSGGAQVCSTGTWGSCSGQTLPQQEICNDGIDQDCSGADLTSNTNADMDCDQLISWTELNNAISDWINNQLYSWTEINQIIYAWLN